MVIRQVALGIPVIGVFPDPFEVKTQSFSNSAQSTYICRRMDLSVPIWIIR